MYMFGSFRLDVAERRLFNDETPVPLRRQAFDLLTVLVEAAGRLKTRDELIEALWPNTLVVEHNLTTVVSELRRALGDEDKAPCIIETVRGCGYRLITPIQRSGGIHKGPGQSTNGMAPEPKVTEVFSDRDTTPPGQAAAADGKTHLTGPDGPAHRHISHRRTAFGLFLAFIVASTIILGWQFSRSARSATKPQRESDSPGLPKSIAVLPFLTIGDPKTNTHFGVGLQEMLLTELADIPHLKVIAQASTQDYASRPGNLAAIARRLGVRSVLEGNVQENAGEIRVNVELLDPLTNTIIWAGSYTRTLSSIFKLQNTIARNIVTALKIHLLKSISQRIRTPPTQNAAAYDFFLRGEYEHQLSTRTGSATALEQSILYYHQAIRKDPKFALAYAQLSKALMESYHYGYDRTPGELTQADAAANQALSLEPNLADAHAAKGAWYYLGRHSLPEARKELKKALSLKPQDASVLLLLGSLNRDQGNWRRGLREISLATELNPRNTLALRNLAVTEGALRNYPMAISLEKRAVSVNPESAIDIALLASFYVENGQLNKALKTIRSMPEGIRQNSYVDTTYLQALILKHDYAQAGKVANRLHPGGQLKLWDILFRKAGAYWYDGRREKALRDYAKVVQILRKAVKKQPRDSMMHAFLGLAYAHLGNNAAARREGQRAVNLLPLKNYPLIGPAPLENLAEIYALNGDSKRAIAILHELMSVPAGAALSVALLKSDPVWRSIRKEPGFLALLKSGPENGTIAVD